MPTDSGNVRYAGRSGSHRRTVKTTRLTQTGHGARPAFELKYYKLSDPRWYLPRPTAKATETCMQDLTGRTAFVTGAASGIGLGIATALSQAGVKVMLCDIEEEALAT